MHSQRKKITEFLLIVPEIVCTLVNNYLALFYNYIIYNYNNSEICLIVHMIRMFSDIFTQCNGDLII